MLGCWLQAMPIVVREENVINGVGFSGLQGLELLALWLVSRGSTRGAQ